MLFVLLFRFPTEKVTTTLALPLPFGGRKAIEQHDRDRRARSSDDFVSIAGLALDSLQQLNNKVDQHANENATHHGTTQGMLSSLLENQTLMTEPKRDMKKEIRRLGKENGRLGEEGQERLKRADDAEEKNRLVKKRISHLIKRQRKDAENIAARDMKIAARDMQIAKLKAIIEAQSEEKKEGASGGVDASGGVVASDEVGGTSGTYQTPRRPGNMSARTEASITRRTSEMLQEPVVPITFVSANTRSRSENRLKKSSGAQNKDQ